MLTLPIVGPTAICSTLQQQRVGSRFLYFFLLITVYICIAPYSLLQRTLGRWDDVNHRRRNQTEEKAKVVASVFGEDFIQFLAA